MNKSVIIAILVGVLAIGGGFFALQSNNDSDNDSNNNESTQNTNNTQDPVSQSANEQSEKNPLGLDLSAVSGPYRINIDTTDPDGRKTTAIADIDADGNIQSTITDNGQESSFIYYDSEVYAMVSGESGWTKFPTGEANPINPEELNTGLEQSDIDELQDITEKGTGPCTNGTCRIYEIVDQDGERGTIKVDTTTNRLSDVEIESENDTSVIMSYDYSYPVNIKPPADFTEFEIPDVGDIDSLLEGLPPQ